MKRFCFIISCIVIFHGFLFSDQKKNWLQQAWDSLKGKSVEQVEVYFSPYEDCEKQWLDIIVSASSYVYISCFGITNPNITSALINKQKSGVKVLVCEDKMQSGNKYDKKQELISNGVEVVVKKIQLLEHNKCIVVDDGKGIIIGSWNLSGSNPKRGAQAQDNSIVVIKNSSRIGIKTRDAILRIYKRDKNEK